MRMSSTSDSSDNDTDTREIISSSHGVYLFYETVINFEIRQRKPFATKLGYFCGVSENQCTVGLLDAHLH